MVSCTPLGCKDKGLCSLIAEEKDHRNFLRLVEELNQLLAEKEEKLKSSSPVQAKVSPMIRGVGSEVIMALPKIFRKI
jgi:hypothetical protein